MPARMQGEGSGRAAETLRWEGGGSRSVRARRPERMQWPHHHHPLTQPRPPPQLVGGRITPPSLWEPAGPAKRDSARQQVHPQCCHSQALSLRMLASVDQPWSVLLLAACIQATRAVLGKSAWLVYVLICLVCAGSAHRHWPAAFCPEREPQQRGEGLRAPAAPHGPGPGCAGEPESLAAAHPRPHAWPP